MRALSGTPTRVCRKWIMIQKVRLPKPAPHSLRQQKPVLDSLLHSLQQKVTVLNSMPHCLCAN